jgi:selenoprotein W-related protein
LGGLAVGLTESLLKDFEAEIDSIRIIPSDGGRFEVTVNGKLIFSKLESRRRAEIAEIHALVRDCIEK